MTGSRHFSARDLWDLFSVVLIVSILYVAYLAPVRIIHGEVKRPIEYFAGAIGIAFWGLAVLSFSKVIV